MSYALARVKWGLGGINVHDGPDGKIIDAIEPHGVHIQTVGTPMILRHGRDWVEVMYARPRSKPERGWVAERCLHIDWQTFKGTVHEAQEDHLKSVSFPKPSDIPHIERECMPETDPLMSKRSLYGFWLIVGLSLLVAYIAFARTYLHLS